MSAILTFLLILLAVALVLGVLVCGDAWAALQYRRRHSIDGRLDEWCKR